jgi:hypothetical protein
MRSEAINAIYNSAEYKQAFNQEMANLQALIEKWRVDALEKVRNKPKSAVVAQTA